MPFNGAGTFVSLGVPTFPAVTGEYILASYFNATMNDIFAGLTNCVTRDGQGGFAANVSFSGFKITSLGNGTATNDAVNFGQVFETATWANVATFNGGAIVTLRPQGDNTLYAASTSYVQNELQHLPGGTLPSLTGNAGKFLKVDTGELTVSWAIPGIGQVGSIITTDTTLTSASAGYQFVQMASLGKSVTLPNATTMAVGGPRFIIDNVKGTIPAGIKDNTGTYLGWVPVGAVSLISLADASTTAGKWSATGLECIATTASTTIGTSVYPTAFVTIDATRTLVLAVDATGPNGSLYGIVHDTASGFGALTLIRSSGAATYAACLTATAGQVLVTSCNNTTGFEAVTLSTTGTSITVNTAATSTLATGINWSINSGGMGVVKLGSEYVVGYSRAAANCVMRGLTISGTTVTIGAEAAGFSGSYFYGLVAATATVGLAFTSDGTTRTVRPVTTSGGVAAYGTSATWASTAANAAIRTFGSRFLCFGDQTGATDQALVSLSGTTATVSTFQLSTFATNTITEGRFFDVQLDATRWAVTVQANFHIITDSSGTASVTSSLGPTTTNISNSAQIVRASSTRVTLYGLASTSVLDGGTNAAYLPAATTIDVSSGASVIEVWSGNDYAMRDFAGVGFDSNLRSTIGFGYTAAIPHASANKMYPRRPFVQGSATSLGLGASKTVCFGGTTSVIFDGFGAGRVALPSCIKQTPTWSIGASGGVTQKTQAAFPISNTKMVGCSGEVNGNFKNMFIIEVAA